MANETTCWPRKLDWAGNTKVPLSGENDGEEINRCMILCGAEKLHKESYIGMPVLKSSGMSFVLWLKSMLTAESGWQKQQYSPSNCTQCFSSKVFFFSPQLHNLQTTATPLKFVSIILYLWRHLLSKDTFSGPDSHTNRLVDKRRYWIRQTPSHSHLHLTSISILIQESRTIRLLPSRRQT